jgi:Transposase DDE domain
MSSLQPRMTLDDVRAILISFAGHFERERLLGPRQIVVTLLFMIKDRCGYKRALDTVSALMGAEFGWKTLPPKAGSFSKARHKLTPAEMLAMYRLALASPSAVAARNRWRWRGFRLMAADGSRFLLPAHQPLIDAYLRPLVTGGEAYQPQLLQMTLWDVGACQPVAWCQRACRGKGNGERALLMTMLDSLSSTDLLLLDRGFPSRRLLFELMGRKLPFIARMIAGTSSDFREVAEFLASGRDSEAINFTFRDTANAITRVERLRLVRDCDENGNSCVLVTNLMDEQQFTAKDLVNVYYRRWGIEVAFKDMKMRYKIEGFHGTTPQLIEQEIIALMFLLLIESMIEEAAITTLPTNQRDRDKNDTDIDTDTDNIDNIDNIDEHRPKRCNRAALGDRVRTLLNLAIRTTHSRHLWQEYRRGLNATAQDRARIRRPNRGRQRKCLSQYGRWRFKKTSKKAA